MILLFIVSRHIFFFPLIPVACVENFLSPVRIRVRGVVSWSSIQSITFWNQLFEVSPKDLGRK